MIKIGEKIKELRKNKGLSQTVLASKLKTTQDTISLWELGKSYPDIEMVVKICTFFNVSADYLLDLKEI